MQMAIWVILTLKMIDGCMFERQYVRTDSNREEKARL